MYDLNRDKKKKRKKKTVKKLSSTTACRITTKIPNESSFQIPLHHHPINRKVSKKIDIPKKQSTVINSSITEYPLEKEHNQNCNELRSNCNERATIRGEETTFEPQA